MGVADILTLYAPWRTPGQPPPANPLLDDAATSLAPWTTALLQGGGLVATPSVASGAVGPLAGLFGVLSPFVLLPFAALPRPLAITGMAALDLFAAFLAFYLWRRRRGDGELPAALGAAVWAWAPLRAVWRTWPHAGLIGLFPLLLLAVDLELEPPERRPAAARRALLAGALTIGLVLGGHPSFALLGLVLAAFYALSRIIINSRLALPVAPLAGAGAALLLMAPVLALGRAFLRDGEWLAVRGGIAASPAVPWRVLLLLVDPYYHGNPAQGTWRGLAWSGPDNLVELQLYMGLAVLLLAPMGLVCALSASAESPAIRRREAWFWGGAGAFALLAMLGPLAAVARLVPGQDTVFLSRWKPLLLLAAAALTSLGAGTLARTPLGRRSWVLPGLLLFITLDLSLANLRFDPFPAKPDGSPAVTPGLEVLRGIAPGGGKRFVGLSNAVPPNLATELGMEDVRAHLLFSAGYRRFLARLDPQVFGRHGTFLTFEPETFRPDPTALDLLGVTALIAPPGTPAVGGDFLPVYSGSDADVYARAPRLPARVVARGGASLEETGRVLSFTARRMRWTLDVETAAPATLLLGRSRLPLLDVVSPGTARGDSRAEGLVAIDIPPGRTTIAIDDELPKPLLALSCLGGVLLLGIAAAAIVVRAP